MYKELLKLFTHKEKHMPQTAPAPNVRFDGGDYKPQILASGLVGFRAPYNIKVEPNKFLDVHLNMTCSVFLLFSVGGVAKTVEPGEKIVVRLGGTVEPVFFGEGEVFARAMPLLPPTITIG